MRALILALSLPLAACGGGGGSTGAAPLLLAPPVASAPSVVPSPQASPSSAASPQASPSRAVLGVQPILVVSLSAPGAPAPPLALADAFADADRIIRANSSGLASLAPEYLSLALPAAFDASHLVESTLPLLPFLGDLTRFRHLVLVTHGSPGGSLGVAWPVPRIGVVWVVREDDTPENRLALALCHELGHTWGFAHTATGLMSGNAGPEDLTFSPEQRASVGWP